MPSKVTRWGYNSIEEMIKDVLAKHKKLVTRANYLYETYSERNKHGTYMPTDCEYYDEYNSLVDKIFKLEDIIEPYLTEEQQEVIFNW